MSKTVFIRQAGNTLLNTPLLNKGSAFSVEERKNFNLIGLLPKSIESVEEQVSRAYEQFMSMPSDIDKHIYIRNIQDTNETLFYKLINNHVEEVMPIIYTPTVGAACQRFSQIYRRNRGLFLCYDDKDSLEEIVNNAPNVDVRVIVITDGERILGLGDQGIGGMGIPIGKLALYSACGGVNPAYTLPIVIDVGTNNSTLLSDPLYMGWRNSRVSGEEYYQFIDRCIKALRQRWPNVLIQFEDFAQSNAMPLLERYKDKICCFNDDIQGTASVTVGTILSACNVTKKPLSEQKIVFAGAGSAGCGIAEAIIAQMVKEGISEEKARQQIFMVDRCGMLEEGMPNLLPFQKKLIQSNPRRSEWKIELGQEVSLLDVIKNVKPDVLIGVTGVPGLFSQEVIESIVDGCEKPLIMPLSNPISRVEATPQDIITWSKGKAIVTTGSPFKDVIYEGKTFAIAQCNNSYIFPGVGLGVLISEANRITNEMFQVASETLAEMSPMLNGKNSLLPALADIQVVSKYIALAVAKKAVEQAVASPRSEKRLQAKLDELFWDAKYSNYKRVAS